MTQVRLSATGGVPAAIHAAPALLPRLLQRPALVRSLYCKLRPGMLDCARPAVDDERYLLGSSLQHTLQETKRNRESLDVLSKTWKNGRIRGAAVKATRVDFGSWRRTGGPWTNWKKHTHSTALWWKLFG